MNDDIDDDMAGDVNNAMNNDGPLVSRPIFELGRSIGPFLTHYQIKAYQTGPLKIELINSIQFLIS